LGAALGVLTALLITWLGAALWDRRIGVIAGAIAALCPPLIALNSTMLSESLFVPLELGVALAMVALSRGRAAVPLAALVGVLCGVAALTRTVGILWLVPVLAAIFTLPISRRMRMGAAAAMLASCVATLAPWAIRNANAFHAFVPLTTQDGFTLVGQIQRRSARDDRFQAVARVPSRIPSLTRTLAPLYLRPGGVNEAQLDSRLTHDAFSYIAHHPSQVPIAITLDSLRMFNLGKNHGFTTELAYREMSLPRSLWSLTTITIQLITLFAIIGIIARVTGRLKRPLGTPLIWAIPLLVIAASVPVVGTVRYRVPADPFLILWER
jgi:4-amino-4-deoxy-L-arabinose transferase-like glycosyltransferase